ncbi:MAG TPA: penicillin-binding protein [Bacteroidia bacterium]|nr:penicillin-binding protein [Bacteroidia bacterium]
MEERKDILWRVYLVYICCCVFGLAVLGRVFYIQFAQGDYWKTQAANFMNKEEDIEAVRGNIFAKDGSLLATSLPYYEVGIDPLANSFIDDRDFEDSARLLSRGMAALLGDRKADEYYRTIVGARAKGLRYQVLARNVSYKELQEMKKLALFRGGRYRGGFIYVPTNHRERPFRLLAERTIGYIADSGRVRVGLEGAYDSVLTGTRGKRLMQKIAGGVWMPLNNENEIEPQQGKDIVTTIDINIQDVAENALMNSLIEHNAKYGCVVLMEVATGEIRAIANLTRQDSGVYTEDYNYAIADAREPGSTFKLASLLVGVDDGLVDIDQKVDLEGGHHTYFDLPMRDAETPKQNVVTVKEAFWESSNVGISKVIWGAYAKTPKNFTDGLHRLRFGEPLGLSIKGEGKSMIKNAGDKNWYGPSLPFVSIGYESLITPMQTLTLYNSIANNGVMVKPMFVKEIREKGKTIKTFQPEIINPAVAKPQTIAKAKILLEGVVKYGTARNLSNSVYPIAGKTGTAQIAKARGYGQNKNDVTYQASFVGYFPADKPKYSCIVIVNAPSGDVYYGGKVAGPIFRQIADRVFATELDIHTPVNDQSNPLAEVPLIRNGIASATLAAAGGLMIDVRTGADFNPDGYVTASYSGKEADLKNISPDAQLRSGIMPDLTGMCAADVLYLMENRGYRVKLKGAGSVSGQSVAPGQKISKQTVIEIELSI